MNATTSQSNPETVDTNALLALRVSEVSERWPDSMRVLEPLGIDLCCGGGRALGEALTLHGADIDQVLSDLARIIESTNGNG